MSKKFFIILISAILGLLVLSLVGYYFIIQNGSTTTGEGGLSFRSFLPFGGDTPAPTENQNPTEEIPSTEQPPASNNFVVKLRKLSSEPVAGAGVLDIKAGTVVRYIEKATGHIYEVEMFSPNQGRVSNTTIPLVYDALWSGGATSLFARYLKDDDTTVDSYTLLLKNATTTMLSSTASSTETISGISFPGGISDASVFGNSIFYLQQSTGFTQGYVSGFNGTNKKLIWSSEIKELNPQFVNDRTVALNTKPYQNIPGYLYFVDTSNGQSRRILGNIGGLSSIVNGQATEVLYLEQSKGVNRLFLYNVSGKSTKDIYPVTFPEKCVWSKKDLKIVYCAVPKETISSQGLTNWYMGDVSFSDEIWKYDLDENSSAIVIDLPAEAGESIDVIKPILSENEQYLVFINKKDNSLWSLDLTK